MVDYPDIWRVANLLVKRHGADAAVRRSTLTSCSPEGDAEGCAVWKRILAAVIARTAPAEARG